MKLTLTSNSSYESESGFLHNVGVQQEIELEFQDDLVKVESEVKHEVRHEIQVERVTTSEVEY